MIAVLSVVAVAAICLGLGGPARAEILIDVFPAESPNGLGSPSYADWQSNAVYAIGNGFSAYGNPSLPSYYQTAPSVLPISANIVTNFPSWQGNADPATTYGSAFASELGNRLAFGLHVMGGSTTFSISQLSFTATSGDPSGTLGFTFPTGSYNYGAGYVGIQYVNGIDTTGGVTLVTSGSNDQLVNELVGRGSGNAWDVYDTSPGATFQAKLDYVANGVWRDTSDGSNPSGPDYLLQPTPFNFTGTYTLGGASGSGSVAFVPEPGTLALLGMGGLGLLAYARRRRRS
jgi:hypothetical protein